MTEDEAAPGLVEHRKAMFEFLRHLMTLDSAALVLIVTLIEKVFAAPERDTDGSLIRKERRMHTRTCLCGALALSLSVASCGGGGSEAATPATGAPTALTVTVTAGAPLAIAVPIVAGRSDPFGGNAAGTALLDFDGDGRKDLLITPSYLSAAPELPVILFRQTAAGFVDASAVFGGTVPTTGVARTVLIGDFNGDGKDDYFAADTGLEVRVAGSLPGALNSLFASNGAGGLTTTKVPTSAFNHGACKGDIDSDGRLDIVVTPLSQPKTYVLKNGAGGLAFDQSRLPSELTSFAALPNFNPSACAIADINGDGKPDLVAASYDDGVASMSPNAPFATGVRIFANDGTGRFLPSTATLPRPPGADWGSTSVYVADFDGNGLPDILVAWETSTGRFALQLWSQTVRGTFVDVTVAAFGGYETHIGFWRELDVGDFNGDGKPDIYLRKLGVESGTFVDSLRASILLNDGTGKFAIPALPLALSAAVSPVFCVVEGAAGRTLTLVCYQPSGTATAYTQLTPMKLAVNF